MAALDDQQQKPRSVQPDASSPAPQSTVRESTPKQQSTLSPRPAFTPKQWQQRLTPQNTPQTEPAIKSNYASIREDPAFIRLRDEAAKKDDERFRFGMQNGWSSERIESELTGVNQRIADRAMQNFAAYYPEKALHYAQTDRATADAVTNYVQNNKIPQLTPEYEKLAEFTKTHSELQRAESAKRYLDMEKRWANEAQSEQDRRNKMWGRSPTTTAAPLPQQGVSKTSTQAHIESSPPQEKGSLDKKELKQTPGKTTQSEPFIGNVNVGAQKSKLNESNARTIAFQQGIKAQQVKPAPPTPTAPAPISRPPLQKTNKAATAAGLGIMGVAGVGKIIVNAARKGFAGAEKPQSPTDNPGLTFLERAYGRWRDLLRKYESLTTIRTFEQFEEWLKENPGASHPTLRALLTIDDWKDHDAYEDYLRKSEEQQRSAREKTQSQPQKKAATHKEEFYAPPHYSSHEEIEEEEESPTEAQTSQTGGQSAAPSRQPPPESSNNQQPSPPRRRGRPRVPGRGALSGARSALGAVTKIARVAAFMWPWGVIIIAVIIVIIVIFRPDDPSDGTHSGEISITTGNTQVNNAELSSPPLGASTGPAGERAVLGAIDDITNILKNSVEKLKDLAQKHKDSLITYTITASYDGPAREIAVSYPIPEDTMLINASGVYKEEKGADRTTGVEKTTKITWLFTENSGSTSSAATSIPTSSNSSTGGISFTKYTQLPYSLPAPQSTSDTAYNQTTINALNKLGNLVSQNQTYLRTKYNASLVDPFLSVIWVGAIEGIGDNPYFWNCREVVGNINAGCPGGYYSGGWQVGYGIQVAQVGGHVANDFDSVYGTGSSNNASTVQRVGQAVISGSGGKITNPSTFPSTTIPALVSSANSGNQSAQQALAILLMDSKLGATLLSLEVAADISSRNPPNWRATMEGWGSYYTNNMQNFSNRAKAIADKYSGTGGGIDNGGGSTFGNKSFTVTILPLKPDIIVDSGIATMDVDEIAGSTSTTATGSGMTSGDMGDGRHVPPSTNSCGKYSLSSNPAGKNYGDPTCNYEKNKLFDMLKKLDPANANLWFNKVIPCESAYDPNTFYRSGSEGDTPDPYGAWGLFQMGRGVNGPFTDLTKGSTNNPSLPEDRGDVNWEMQISNAVNFNRKYLSSKGRPMGDYWACAR